MNDTDTTATARILELPVPGNDTAGTVTGREWLAGLLRATWLSRDLFGLPGCYWPGGLYAPMTAAGLVTGSYDDDGGAHDVDFDAADELIVAAIDAMGQSPASSPLPSPADAEALYVRAWQRAHGSSGTSRAAQLWREMPPGQRLMWADVRRQIQAASCRRTGCTCEAEGDDRCEYRMLADAIETAFSVRDGDEAEVALLTTAIGEAGGKLDRWHAGLRRIARTKDSVVDQAALWRIAIEALGDDNDGDGGHLAPQSHSWADELADSGLRSITGDLNAGHPVTWSSAVAPGGTVCAVPDPAGPDGICGMPVESEPCGRHGAVQPEAVADEIEALATDTAGLVILGLGTAGRAGIIMFRANAYREAARRIRAQLGPAWDALTAERDEAIAGFIDTADRDEYQLVIREMLDWYWQPGGVNAERVADWRKRARLEPQS